MNNRGREGEKNEGSKVSPDHSLGQHLLADVSSSPGDSLMITRHTITEIFL